LAQVRLSLSFMVTIVLNPEPLFKPPILTGGNLRFAYSA